MQKVHQSLQSTKLRQSHSWSLGKSSRKCSIDRRTTTKNRTKCQGNKTNGKTKRLLQGNAFSFPMNRINGSNKVVNNQRPVHLLFIFNDTNHYDNVKFSKILRKKKR